MNFREYQQEAGKTPGKKYDAVGFALSIAGEAGEVVELIKKHYFHGKELDRERLKEELGDLIWGVANLARVNGIDLDDVATGNVKKIFERYPQAVRPSLNQLDIIREG